MLFHVTLAVTAEQASEFMALLAAAERAMDSQMFSDVRRVNEVADGTRELIPMDLL